MRMFNETLMLKVLLARPSWLPPFLFHSSIRLSTSKFSYGLFFFSAFSDEGSSWRGSVGDFFPPSNTVSAALVSRSWRCWRNSVSISTLSRRKVVNCFWVNSVCSRPDVMRLRLRNSSASSCNSRSEHPVSSVYGQSHFHHL